MCDNCPELSNPDQRDLDENGEGDACQIGFGVGDGELPGRGLGIGAPNMCGACGAGAQVGLIFYSLFWIGLRSVGRRRRIEN